MSNTLEPKFFSSMSNEFAGANFGDLRLTRRLMDMSDGIAQDPKETLPKLLGEGAGIEGGYRFLRNPRVNLESILASHFEQTVLRAKLEKEVLVLHDTTEFKFPSKRKGLGLLSGSRSAGDGFYGHFSLVVGSCLHRPVGVVAVEPMIKLKKKGYQSPSKTRQDPTRKSLRWMRGIVASESRLGFAAKPIHVMDREADFFELLSELKDSSGRCVIRVCRDRLVTDENLEEGVSLYSSLESAPVKLQREVRVGTRAQSPLPQNRKDYPARQQRTAMLSATAARVELIRGHHHGARLNKTVTLNVVHVFESNPPEGTEPIDWKLLTTESTNTPADIEKVIDIYRARWLIEEYFKAIKTGCAFEERQLESKDTIFNALAIFIPIAWRMLLLRAEARQRPLTPATVVLTPTQISVLRAVSKTPIPENPTVAEAISAVARLGGHLKQNGPPGWKILGKGLTELLTLEKGWLAKERCDQ